MGKAGTGSLLTPQGMTCLGTAKHGDMPWRDLRHPPAAANGGDRPLPDAVAVSEMAWGAWSRTWGMACLGRPSMGICHGDGRAF